MSELPYTGERVVPWSLAVGGPVMSKHVARYAWAMPSVYYCRVVDIGCGAGYGSFLMSWGAREVHGVDVSEEAVIYARAWFRAANLHFSRLNVARETLPEAEVYVAFEVLEHLDRPQAVIDGIHDATLLWSLPVDDGSRFHKHTYSLAEAESLLDNSCIWYQSQDGCIVPRRNAWFTPANVIGMAQL